ncbi:diacylglycerol kinase family protein [Sphaerisporangium sp. TRM90804]|uniref:diacylglycerol/lipid kinase family protein n=1 Tax=Sphaerisporangium sp. TRM90804 TaxID=3031113 RepID=UPI00244A12FE|nr:diacylglycerol kinase family protein [Sphaerisporangium sp. TRM90804]MDH2426157.1 diacylglycerol kinase family protein [Sphaerisporangium sp. TRM90804]
MRRLLAIGNPSAGSADDTTYERVMAVLSEHADTVPGTVQDPADLPRLLGEHPGRDPVVLGGDGSLHNVVAALARRGELHTRTVGLIPLGTGNDLARTLGIPLDPERAAAVAAADGHPRWMDLLLDEQGGVVVNALHLGVGVAAGEAATPLKPFLRRFAYAVGSLVAGVRAEGWRVRVTLDDQTLADGRRRVLMVGAGNGATIGGGTPLAPDALPDDGLADVVVSFATGPLQRLRYGLMLRRGRQARHREVTTARGRRLRVAGPPMRLNIDGEFVGPLTDRTWTVRPRAWRITVPPSSPSADRPAAAGSGAAGPRADGP